MASTKWAGSFALVLCVACSPAAPALPLDAGVDAAHRLDARLVLHDVGPPVDTDVVDAFVPPPRCGGATDPACADGELCDYSGALLCGRADGRGVCVPIPASCAPDDAPVCGCDRVTYANACEATRAGASVSELGVCHFPCGTVLCATNHEYCLVSMWRDASARQTSYGCVALPASCGPEPTCASCGFADCAGAHGQLTVQSSGSPNP